MPAWTLPEPPLPVPERGPGTAAVRTALHSLLCPHFGHSGSSTQPVTKCDSETRAVAGDGAVSVAGGDSEVALVLASTGHRRSPLPRAGERSECCRAAAIERAEWSGDPCQAQGWKRKLEDGKRRASKGWRGKVKVKKDN